MNMLRKLVFTFWLHHRILKVKSIIVSWYNCAKRKIKMENNSTIKWKVRTRIFSILSSTVNLSRYILRAYMFMILGYINK